MEETIVYDIVNVPDGLTLDQLLNIHKNTNYLLYDSSNGGNKPTYLNGKNIEFILDTSVSENKELVEKLIIELKNKKDEI